MTVCRNVSVKDLLQVDGQNFLSIGLLQVVPTSCHDKLVEKLQLAGRMDLLKKIEIGKNITTA